MTFNASRLVLARKRRGLSKKALAEAIGVQPRSISGFENSEFCPSTHTVNQLVRTLKFPVEFFEGFEIDVPPRDAVSFRSFSRMSARERDAALGACGIALLLNDWIEERFVLPPPNLPYAQFGDPEAAADFVRSDWQLGYRPIKNIVHLLEAKGVRVFSLSQDTRRMDAFSFWRSDTPFVFLNTAKSAERSRFDAAHELGHLVLHRHGGPIGQGAEAQANAFASAFLMPSSSVFATVRRSITANQLIELKKKWIVSAVALAYRLWKLRVLSNWHYRSVCIDLAPFRKQEPEPAPREQSQVLQKVFQSLEAEGIRRSDVARELGIHRRDLEELVFGLATIDGGAQRAKGKPANLQLVK